jgi:polysaccharide export outer membrane protein
LRSLWIIFAIVIAAWAAACAPRRAGLPRNIPAPVLNYSIAPGDLFEITVFGEDKLTKEYRVHPDGTIVVPYVERLQVAGLEPQQIEEMIARKLLEKRILKSPQVTLVVKQYASKKISVIGAVGKPGVVPWTEGIKLVDAISQAGGFSPMADKDRVILTRQVAPKKSATFQVDVEAITRGEQPDIPLQAGDSINVEQRAF